MFQPLEIDPMPYLEVSIATERVHRYFDEYSGRRFEFLGGGGGRTEVANRFVSDDLVAVSLLSVDIPGGAALTILEERSSELEELLFSVPTGLDLWNAPVDLIADGHEADQLWQALESIPGIGWVIAGKLCARKRPQLLPIFDSVVKAALSPTRRDFWTALHTTLTQRPEIVDRLAEIRRRSEIDERVSLLRVLDVSVWMSGRDEATGATSHP